MNASSHFDIIKSPLLTEKTTDLRDHRNQLVFRIDSRANKRQVAEAIYKIFNVNVASVRIINVPSKPKRLGKYEGRKPGFKKAIVSLKEGDTIEIFERIE